MQAVTPGTQGDLGGMGRAREGAEGGRKERNDEEDTDERNDRRRVQERGRHTFPRTSRGRDAWEDTDKDERDEENGGHARGKDTSLQDLGRDLTSPAERGKQQTPTEAGLHDDIPTSNAVHRPAHATDGPMDPLPKPRSSAREAQRERNTHNTASTRRPYRYQTESVLFSMQALIPAKGRICQISRETRLHYNYGTAYTLTP